MPTILRHRILCFVLYHNLKISVADDIVRTIGKITGW